MKRITIKLPAAIFLRVPSPLTALIAIIIIATCSRLLAQNFPAGNWNDFSDVMVETPNTAMVIDPDDVPLVQPQPDFQGTPASVEPNPPQPGDNYEGPIGVTGVIDNVTTGCSYSPLSHNALRGPITDIDVPGALGKYGLKMRRYYNSRSSQYWDVAVCLSPGWFHEYSWLMWVSGQRIVSPQGNVSDDSCDPPVGISEWWDSGDRPSNGTGIWRLADGGKVYFSSGFADYVEDPYGVRTTIARDGSNRVSRVTEAGGRYLQFTYGSGAAYTDPAYGNKLLKMVEARDGRGNLIETVTYTYSDVDSGGIIPPNGQHIIRKMLTGVTYGDNTSASYTYRDDNVPNNLPHTFKFDPLLEKCNDKRYGGPMRRIQYQYQPLGPHGAITDERYPGENPVSVSAIAPGVPTGGTGTTDTFYETRGGDGPMRSFTYTHIHHCQNECQPPCDDYSTDGGPDHQQMLRSYTDFNGNGVQLGYDPNWYISSVTDANDHQTRYTRGNPPYGTAPRGIGQVADIAYPSNSGTLHYDYQDESGAIGGHYLTSVRDENNHTTTVHRDGRHRITQIDYPSDVNTPHEYFTYCDQADSQCNNAFGQLKRHQLKNGAYVHHRYDSRGLLMDKWEPTFSATAVETQPKTHYSYYTGGGWIDRVKTVTGPAPNWQYSQQASETYEYDKNASDQACAGRGLITKITHADNRSQSFRYDQWGNKRSEWNEMGEGIAYAYDNYNRVTSVIRRMYGPSDETTTYTYNPTNGGGSPYRHTTNNPDTITLSPSDIQTSNVYDENFRKTSTTVAGRMTRFHYDPVGNQDCVSDPRGGGADPCSTTYTTHFDYDVRNRKWRIREPLGRTTQFMYDSASNIIDIQRPDATHEIKTYDAMNRVLTDTVPKDNTHSITTTFQYNLSGTLQWVKDGENHQYSFEYNNPSDLKTKMIYPDTSYQSWAYDDAHNMKTRTSVGGKTQDFAYDNRNRQWGKAWENAEDEWVIFAYDGASRLRRAVNGGWNQNLQATITSDIHRDYDHAGRLILDKQDIDGENNGLGPLEVHYEYDPTLRGTNGKPTRMYVGPGPGYDYDFRYDEMGRFAQILPHGSTNPSFQYSYDNASNETQRDNFLTHIQQIYDPDELNRTRKVELQYNNSRFWLESYGYDAMSRLHTVTRGSWQDQFNYYLDGELRSVFYDATPADAPDPNEIPPAEDPDKEKTVDDFVALPSSMEPDASQTVHSVTYDLDNAGNRVGVTDSLSGTTSYAPNNINQYINNVGGDAINNGTEHEISSYKSVSYTYMKDEHLVRTTSGAGAYDLAYDALGRCIKRTLRTQTEAPDISPRPTPTPRPPPTPAPRPSPPPPSPTPPPGITQVTKYYIYDGDRPILEYDGNGDLAGYNLYGKGVDEILARNDPTLPAPQTVYYQQDHEGSVTFLTYLPPQGVSPILEYYRYDVFGKPAIYGPPPSWSQRTASLYSNRFLFTGREYAANFGFYEYRARAYSPGLGRFMSEDPKLFVHGAGFEKPPADWSFAAHPDEAEFNLFRYCGNDPIDFTDPLGLNFDGTKDADEVESIPKRFGQTGGEVHVAVEDKDGSFGLRLDLKITLRQVARKVFWHGRMVTRRPEQMKVTSEEHEKKEHNKDYKGFHDEHQKDVSGARFQSREAATAAAKAEERRLTLDLKKAAKEYNEHKDRQRWERIERRERPW